MKIFYVSRLDIDNLNIQVLLRSVYFIDCVIRYFIQSH